RAHGRLRTERVRAFLRDVLEIEPLLVPSDDARADAETLERTDLAAIQDLTAAHDRAPAFLQEAASEPRASDEIDARDVHEADIAAGIQMNVEIAVVRQHQEVHDRFAERVDARAKDARDHDAQEAKEEQHSVTRLRSRAVTPRFCCATARLRNRQLIQIKQQNLRPAPADRHALLVRDRRAAASLQLLSVDLAASLRALQPAVASGLNSLCPRS